MKGAQFTIWVKRARRHPPLARARGSIRSSTEGSRIEVALPVPRSDVGGLFAAALFGWLVAAPVAFLDFFEKVDLPWAPYVAAFFAGTFAVTLGLSLARAEAQDLELQIAGLLRSIDEGATSGRK